jgi:vacuolar-type H+-ATPase subunit H
MDDYSRFKRSLNGFDKDDVLEYIQKEKDEHARRITEYKRTDQHREKLIRELQDRIKDLNKRIAELNDHIVRKDEQMEQLEKDVNDKYEKYISNYQQIGEILFEAKLRGNQMITDAQSQVDQMLSDAQSHADQIVNEAQEKADQCVNEAKAQAEKIRSDAEAEAKQRVDSTKGDIDAQISLGREKYLAVQNEMNEVLNMFNQVQKKFMQSYKDIHEIADSMPGSIGEEAVPKSTVTSDDEFESDDLDNLDDPDDELEDPDGPKLRGFSLNYSDDDFDPDDDLDDDDFDEEEESRIG